MFWNLIKIIIATVFVLFCIPAIETIYRIHKEKESQRVIIKLGESRTTEKIGSIDGYDVYEITYDREVKGYITIPQSCK